MTTSSSLSYPSGLEPGISNTSAGAGGTPVAVDGPSGFLIWFGTEWERPAVLREGSAWVGLAEAADVDDLLDSDWSLKAPGTERECPFVDSGAAESDCGGSLEAIASFDAGDDLVVSAFDARSDPTPFGTDGSGGALTGASICACIACLCA